MVAEMSLAFVVSTGRCGSTLLSSLLRANPDILSVGELFGLVSIEDRLTGHLDGPDFWRQISDPVPYMDTIARDVLAPAEFRYPYATGRFTPENGVPFISHMTLPALTDNPDRLYYWLAAIVPSWPIRPVADHYRHLFALLAEKCGGSVIVERTSGSISSVARIRRAFPEARFIYLSRDGVDCAWSMSKHPGARLLARTELDKASQPSGRSKARTAKKIMESEIPLAAFGNLWSSMTQNGAAELSAIPLERWTTLRFEQLVQDPATSLRRLARFLGAAASPGWLLSAVGQIEPARSTCAGPAPDDLAGLRAACSPGYVADASLHALHAHLN